MYLTPPIPVGKGPYKYIEHRSPGLLGTWLLSFMSDDLFRRSTLWQISHDAINLLCSVDRRTDLFPKHIYQLLLALATHARIG